MRHVRRVVLEKKVVEWAYGHVSHCMKNYCEYFAREYFTEVVKQGSFVSKTIWVTSMCRILFESVSFEKLKML